MPNIPILSTSYPNRVKSTHEGAKSLWPTLEPGILTVTSTELNSLLAYLTKYLLRPMLRKKRTRGVLSSKQLGNFILARAIQANPALW
jgi:hypothetical protein